MVRVDSFISPCKNRAHYVPKAPDSRTEEKVVMRSLKNIFNYYFCAHVGGKDEQTKSA